MTPQQNAVLIALRDLTVDGVSPTIRELMAHTGMNSTHQVHNCVLALEQQGFIRRTPNRRRRIEIIERSGASLSDNRIAAMSDVALESALVRISKALSQRRTLSGLMKEMAA